MGRKRSYKYAVKRPKLSKKDTGKAFRKAAGLDGGISKKDIKKLKKKYGGIPRMPGLEPRFNANRMSRDVYERRKNRYYERLDGGTVDTMYIKGPGPKRKKSKSRKSRDRDREPSFETSSTDQQLIDFQKEREEMFARYEKMMIEQAKQAEKQRKQMEIAMRAQAQNAYSASLQPNFQLQGAGETPKLSAAQQFRKRLGSQFGTASPYTGLAQIQSGMVNA